MFTIKKILVPTDFSDNASHAYAPAQKIATQHGATIDFIHVIPTLHYLNESLDLTGLPINMQHDMYPKLQKQASQRIDTLMKENLQLQNIGKGIIGIAPRPSREVTRTAKDGNYDLILMAANGAHESDFLKGNITEKIIRHSTIPVLTTGRASFDSIKNILVPVDGSQASLKALPIAASTAVTYEASITLYHVLELHGSLFEGAYNNPSKTKVENIRNTILQQVETFLEESWDNVELRRGDDTEAQLVYSEGASSNTINLEVVTEKRTSAHHAITSYANDHADMIVMTTLGRSGLAHMFLGSTAEKVSQHSACPLITIKPDFEKAN